MSFLDNSNKQLWKNFTSLGFLQITNYLVPLILVPYLVRTIGIELFGLTSFAQAIMAYFVVAVEYSFTITATKRVSQNKNNKEELGHIVTSVYSVKLLLTLLSFLILMLLIAFIPKLNDQSILYASGFLIVIGQMLFPNWLFLGLENMKFLPILNIVARLSTLALVLVFVQNPNDFLLVLPSYAIGNILSGIIGIVLIYAYFKIPFKGISFENIKNELKSGFALFISSFFSSLLWNSGIVILGMFANNLILGYYSTAEKLINVIRQVLISLYHATYPRICELAQGDFSGIKNLIRKIYIPFYILFSIGLLLCAILSDHIIYLIAGEYIDRASNLFVIMLLAPLFNAFNIPPNQILLAFNYNKLYSFVIISGALLSIVLQFIFVPFYFAKSTAIILVITEFYITLCFYLLTISKKPELSLIRFKKAK